MSASSASETLALVAAARAVRENAYAPYSSFRVGAALLSAAGHIHAGCNVENASYGATLCAERCALVQLVASGERSFTALAVYTESAELTMPCGMCRQVLFEFGPAARVVVANARSSREMTLDALLPEPFILRP